MSADERKTRVGHGAKTAAVREQAIVAAPVRADDRGCGFPMSRSVCDALEVIWPLHRRHCLSPPEPGTLDAGADAVSVPLVATTGRELAARALLAADGSVATQAGRCRECNWIALTKVQAAVRLSLALGGLHAYT